MSLAISVEEGDRRRSDRAWIARAMAKLEAERLRAIATPLLRLDLPEIPGVQIWLKDESAHPSGSIKHRLAQALFAHAICNGDIGADTPVVEASSGSTAISLAWFADLLGVPFTAVVAHNLPSTGVARLRWAGCAIARAEPGEEVTLAAYRIASERGGHYMNQSARAAEVSDWRTSSTLAESLFAQVSARTGLAPLWVVAGAGTGGTSATLGRYIRYRPEFESTRLCVVDPERSAYFSAYVASDWSLTGEASALVDGIGRGRIEASFCPSVVDLMVKVPDIASIAAMHWLAARTGQRFGPSTGTNIVGAMLLAHAMARQGQPGSIVTLGCNGGRAYADTLYDARWLARKGIDIGAWRDLPSKLAAFALPTF